MTEKDKIYVELDANISDLLKSLSSKHKTNLRRTPLFQCFNNFLSLHTQILDNGNVVCDFTFTDWKVKDDFYICSTQEMESAKKHITEKVDEYFKMKSSVPVNDKKKEKAVREAISKAMAPSRKEIKKMLKEAKFEKESKDFKKHVRQKEQAKEELLAASKALLKLIVDKTKEGEKLEIDGNENTPSFLVGESVLIGEYISIAKELEMFPHFKLFKEGTTKNGGIWPFRGHYCVGTAGVVTGASNYLSYPGRVHICLNKEDKELFDDAGEIKDVEMGEVEEKKKEKQENNEKKEIVKLD